jgi:transcription elongation factor SPT6
MLSICFVMFYWNSRRSKARRKGPSKAAAGISSMALQEAQEIFGDVTELLDRRKSGMNSDQLGEDADDEGYRLGRPSKKKLEDEFEPSVLEEKYMTEKDNRIREIDMPERLQVSVLLCAKCLMEVK